MRNLCSTLIITLFVCLSITGKAQEVNIIPYPQQIDVQSSNASGFILQEGIITYTNADILQEASFLGQKLSSLGKTMTLKKGKKAKKGIVLSLDKKNMQPEAYTLQITPEQINIEGGSPAGVFYGIQSLLQLIDHKNDQTGISCCNITDDPRYSWRGYMLDESRHFFGKEKVKQLLDIMAYYKLNKFHWHLTDESGWRIEIKKYPLLTTIGGKGSWSDPDLQAQFYTQEDIREIVAYATERHIEIIPEIDMPGHASAANKAYPEYSGGGTPEHPDFTFNVGKEKVYSFLTDILREVTGLFPSTYLHIGGDEVAFGIKAWEKDPDVQALMKKEGLSTVKEAEHYFICRMADSVKVLGKKVVGWDELLDSNVDTANTLIMWWRHDRINVLKNTLAKGLPTIMCPRRPLYFDFIQHKDHKWGRVWNGFCPLEDVYAFPDKGMAEWELPQEQLALIVGIQGNAWTERIHTAERLDYMTFPRLCALAEAAWTNPEIKNYTSFSSRMEDAYSLFDRLSIYYFDHRNPQRRPEPTGAEKKQKDVPMDFRD